MGRRTKTRIECLYSQDLNISEIGRLFNTGKDIAKRIFTLAQEREIEAYGGWDKLIRTDKVSMESVLKVKHQSFQLLEKQVLGETKNADAGQSNPQINR